MIGTQESEIIPMIVRVSLILGEFYPWRETVPSPTAPLLAPLNLPPNIYCHLLPGLTALDVW
jgi:hypothetical protein